MKTYQQYINGAWVAPLNGKYTEVYNPSDDSVVGMVANGDEKDADLALQAAQAAQKSWAKLTARRRAEILYAFIEEIKKNKEELARMISTEQGKLFKVAQFEVDVCCSFIAYACEWARRIEGDIVPSDNPNEHLMIQKIPRGVVVAITAWNFPLALAGRKIGPALVAGNTIVVKPTTETPIATLMLGEMAKKAGVPDGVLNIITGSGRVMGTALVENPITKMVTMTGSTPAGQAIYRSAAKNIIHVQLELGGKAPFIVFDDADIDAAVDAALSSRFDNCGQVCTCNERLYLHESMVASICAMMPIASGLYDPDAFTDVPFANGITWGISHYNLWGRNRRSILLRFDCDLSIDFNDPEMKKNDVPFSLEELYRRGLTKKQKEIILKRDRIK